MNNYFIFMLIIKFLEDLHPSQSKTDPESISLLDRNHAVGPNP